jgi:hypothetical protein
MEATMRPTKFNRIFGALISVLLLCASVPAQYQIGSRRMVFRETPTLRNRSRLSVSLGPRPRIGYVGRVGGIASDGVAASEQGLVVNTIAPTYATTRPDGQRLLVALNGQTVTAPIYDWQLIPIAKFADSDSFSCFTMFGRANDAPSDLRENLRENSQHEDDFRYHSDFKDTLVGLRLFQLDSLILDEDAIDLVKNGDTYILGAGESTPNFEENGKGLEVLERFRAENKDLWTFTSYVISDYRRKITFGIHGNRLRIKGEPYVYFWKLDPDSEDQFIEGEAQETVQRSLGTAAQYSKALLIKQVLEEVQKYDNLTEGSGFLSYYVYGLEEILFVPASQRETLLRTKSHAALFDLLVELRAFNRLDWTIEMRELSDKVSNETAMLRTINPAVWDTGVNLIRYAAFFRYCKTKNPQQWRKFMTQINSAPAPKPPVKTPSGFEY